MQDHNTRAPAHAQTQSKPNEYWEFIKNLTAAGLVVWICYTLLTAGGVL